MVPFVSVKASSVDSTPDIGSELRPFGSGPSVQMRHGALALGDPSIANPSPRPDRPAAGESADQCAVVGGVKQSPPDFLQPGENHSCRLIAAQVSACVKTSYQTEL